MESNIFASSVLPLRLAAATEHLLHFENLSPHPKHYSFLKRFQCTIDHGENVETVCVLL